MLPIALVALLTAATSGPKSPPSAPTKGTSAKASAPAAVPTPVAAPVPPPASPAPAPAPVKVKKVKLAANEWCHSNLDAILVATLETRFYDLLGQHNLSVIAPKDVAAVLGIERQRQMMGCTEEASCLAEIGGALGADAVLYGCVIKAGSGMTVTLRLVSTKDAKPVASFSERVASEDALQDWLDARAKVMALKVRQDLGGEDVAAELERAASAPVAPTVAVASTEKSQPGVRGKAWIPLAVGGAGLVAAGLGYWQSEAAYSQFKVDLTSHNGNAEATKARGETAQTIMVAGAVVGVAGLAAGVAMLLWPSDAPVSPVAAVGPSGTYVGVGGSF